jgi:cytochrome c oxidase subunit 4
MSENAMETTAGPGGTPVGAAGAGHAHVDVDQHVKAALVVFGSLLVLTGFTVGAYFMHLPLRAAITLALAIATVKGTLVACWFMHLLSERRLIHWMLLLAAFLFLTLLLVPTFTMLGAVVPR